MATLPFKSFRNVVSLQWPPVEGGVVMTLFPRRHTPVAVCVPLSDIELRYPNFQQAMRYMAGIHTPASHYLGHLKHWESCSNLRGSGSVLIIAGVGRSGQSASAIATLRVDLSSGLLVATTSYGTTWQCPLNDLELQFPGFSHYVRACEAIDVDPEATTRLLLEWLDNFDRTSDATSIVLPSDLLLG